MMLTMIKDTSTERKVAMDWQREKKGNICFSQEEKNPHPQLH